MPLGEMPHILVVDDDTRLRELLRKYLSDNEFRVTVAANAGEARDRMAGLQFDLIVLDRMMPGESGLNFVHNLRPSNPVPILMLTAMGEVEARIDGLEAGVDDYLAAIKAVTPAEVQKAAQLWLDPKKRTTGILHPETPTPASEENS